jgi:dipeptidase E
MKLYLTSYRIPTPSDVYDLIGSRSPRCALIENAKDYRPDDEREYKLQETNSYLEGLGWVISRIDLRTYIDTTALYEDLLTYDCLFVAGGNTFSLRQAMMRSGFDKIAEALVGKGMVYIGESAGAIVAGRTLKGTETADELAAVDEIIWEGLGLVDKVLAPHADNQEFGEYIAHIKTMYEEGQLVLLNDNQAYVANGQTIRLSEGTS